MPDPEGARPGDDTGVTFDAVLAAARANAGWAFARLHKDLAPRVAGYLRAHGAVEPDDLTSEVFLGAFRNLDRFSGDEAMFRSWVFTIAHRRLIDERRRVGRRPRSESLDPSRHAQATSEPGPGAVRAQQHRALSALRRMF